MEVVADLALDVIAVTDRAANALVVNETRCRRFVQAIDLST